MKGTSKMEPELLIIPSEEEEVEATSKKAVPLRAGDGLGAVADALSSGSLGPDSCVRLLWPRHRCPLLSDDVVLVDTPGQFVLCYPIFLGVVQFKRLIFSKLMPLMVHGILMFRPGPCKYFETDLNLEVPCPV